MSSRRLLRSSLGSDSSSGAGASGAPGKLPTTARIARAAESSGAPLSGDLQSRFESSLGADLSGVRVHTGEDSQDAAAALGARAYALGNDIHFGRDQYDASSSGGQFLIAHEVAHTVQQTGSAPTQQTKLEVSSPGDALEVEADAAAGAMVSGAPASVTTSSGIARAIQRDPLPGQTPAGPSGQALPAGVRTVGANNAGETERLHDAIFGPEGYFAHQALAVDQARTDLRGTSSHPSLENQFIDLAGKALTLAAGPLAGAIAGRVVGRFSAGASDAAIKAWTDRLKGAISSAEGWGISRGQSAARVHGATSVEAFAQLQRDAITSVRDQYAAEWATLSFADVTPAALSAFTTVMQEQRGTIHGTQYAQTTGKWSELQFAAADASMLGHHGFTDQSWQIGLEATMTSPSMDGIRIDHSFANSVPDEVLHQLRASPTSATVNSWGGRMNVQLTLQGTDDLTGTIEPADVVRAADGNTWIQAQSANNVDIVVWLNMYAGQHGLPTDAHNGMSTSVANAAAHHILTVVLGQRPVAGIF